MPAPNQLTARFRCSPPPSEKAQSKIIEQFGFHIIAHKQGQWTVFGKNPTWAAAQKEWKDAQKKTKDIEPKFIQAPDVPNTSSGLSSVGELLAKLKDQEAETPFDSVSKDRRDAIDDRLDKLYEHWSSFARIDKTSIDFHMRAYANRLPNQLEKEYALSQIFNFYS